MWKSLVLFACLFSVTANVPIGKVEYLIELLSMKRRFYSVRKLHQDKLKKTYSITEVNRSKFEKLYDQFYSWDNMRANYINYLQKEFNEEEVNKLLAVYEIKESRKLMRVMNMGEERMMKEFLESSKRLKAFNKEFNLKNRPF